jgi:hypothetical protein
LQGIADLRRILRTCASRGDAASTSIRCVSPFDLAAWLVGLRGAGAPVAGANSFTEGQAKSRIEANGFTNVSDLKKDDAGVWRGKASKGSQTMSVSEYDWPVVARDDVYFGYTFDHGWEIAEGVWTKQILYNGRVIAEQKFKIVVPIN